MHYIVERLTEEIILYGFLEKEKKEEYVYGLEVFAEKIVSYGILFVLALWMHMLMPSLLFLGFFFVIRTRTGGYHASSYQACLLSSIIILVMSMKVLLKWLLRYMCITYILLAGASLVIWFLSPVNHPNLNLDSEEVEGCRKSAREILLLECGGILIGHMMKLSMVYLASSAMGMIMCAVLIIMAKGLRQEVNNYGEKNGTS
ncbi:MAG: accessory gene regulator B family protein [Clostridiales bacterium]|nr:accessory gene regulator B family protein [Clostridiales bacterium]